MILFTVKQMHTNKDVLEIAKKTYEHIKEYQNDNDPQTLDKAAMYSLQVCHLLEDVKEIRDEKVRKCLDYIQREIKHDEEKEGIIRFHCSFYVMSNDDDDLYELGNLIRAICKYSYKIKPKNEYDEQPDVLTIVSLSRRYSELLQELKKLCKEKYDYDLKLNIFY